jgi:hypothetical protein
MEKPKTLRGNYILFRYVIEESIPVIELKDRNGKFWYCRLTDGVFKVTSVTSKSLFDELPPELENP